MLSTGKVCFVILLFAMLAVLKIIRNLSLTTNLRIIYYCGEILFCQYHQDEKKRVSLSVFYKYHCSIHGKIQRKNQKIV